MKEPWKAILFWLVWFGVFTSTTLWRSIDVVWRAPQIFDRWKKYGYGYQTEYFNIDVVLTIVCSVVLIVSIYQFKIRSNTKAAYYLCLAALGVGFVLYGVLMFIADFRDLYGWS